MSMLGHYASYPLVTEHGLRECPCHGSAGSVGLFERHKGSKNFKYLNAYVVDKGFKLLEFSDSFKTLGWGDAFYRRNNKK